MAVLFHNTNFAEHVVAGRSNMFLPGASLGEIGVDLFFVLSGFLMVTTTRNTAPGSAATGRFLFARAIRIYPTYWLVARPWALICALWPSIHSGEASAPLLQNLLLAPATAAPQLRQAWSLIFEIWFYGVFGLILMSSRRGAWLCLWAVWLLGCAVTGYRLPTALGALASNPLALEFLMGCALACAPAPKAGGQKVGLSILLLLAGGAGMLLGEVARFRLPGVSAESEIWRVALVGLPASAVVFGALGLEAADRFKAPQWMQGLGDRSYALYLINDPVAVSLVAVLASYVGFASRLPGDAIVLAGTLLISLVLTEAAHRFVERPCMELARRLRQRKVVRAEILRTAATSANTLS
jgi:peptidoglycan/LPS O-acetylase OafA/YrhL